MRKKIIFPTNIVSHIFAFIFFAIDIVSLYIFIVEVLLYIEYYIELIFSNNINIGMKIKLCIVPLVLVVGIIMLTEVVIDFERPVFILDANKIFTIGDVCISRKKKFQYYTEVEYKNIVSFDIVWSSCNSKGETINTIYSAGKTSPFLAIVDVNAKQYNFSIKGMSKKGMRKFLIELKNRIALSGKNININIEEILKKFPTILI